MGKKKNGSRIDTTIKNEKISKSDKRSLFPLDKKTKAGIALAIIILVITNAGEIYSFLSTSMTQPVTIPLCESNLYTTPKDMNFQINSYNGIPDYYAKINIDFSQKTYSIGDDLKFTLKISDNGIVNLTKPYFYILLFDRDDKARGMFPCFINQNQNSFYISSSITDSWKPWVSPADSQGRYCVLDSFYLSNGMCIDRFSLINGAYSKSPLEYEYKLDKSGTWKIYVLLFEESCKPRSSMNYISTSSCKNSVAYAYSEVNVGSESSKNPIDQNTSLLIFLFKIIIAGIGYYGMSRDSIYPPIAARYNKYKKGIKKEIKNLIIFLILVTIYTIILIKLIT